MIETIEINGEKRYFNTNDRLWDNRIFFILKIWYFLLTVICIINIHLYLKNIHDNDVLLIMIPFFNMLIPGILLFLKSIFIVPSGDKEYILNYYPEIFKKMFYPNANGEYSVKLLGRNGFTILSFANGDYIKENEDEIIEEIRERWRAEHKFAFSPIIFLICFVIISVILIAKKNGLL